MKSEVPMSLNMNQLLKQAQKIQQDMQKIQEELASETVEGTGSTSGVKVVANGLGEILQVRIPKESVDVDDMEMLEDLVLMAIRDAVKKSQELSAERMGKITGGMKLPGLF